MTKDPEAYRTISEVAEALSLPQHVLRFWETKIPQIDPLKRGGGRRYYRPDQVALIGRIKDLLYRDGYTIKGVQRLLKAQGAKAILMPAAEVTKDSASAPARNADGDLTGLDLEQLAALLDDCRRDLAQARGH